MNIRLKPCCTIPQVGSACIFSPQTTWNEKEDKDLDAIGRLCISLCVIFVAERVSLSAHWHTMHVVLMIKSREISLTKLRSAEDEWCTSPSIVRWFEILGRWSNTFRLDQWKESSPFAEQALQCRLHFHPFYLVCASSILSNGMKGRRDGVWPYYSWTRKMSSQ